VPPTKKTTASPRAPRKKPEQPPPPPPAWLDCVRAAESRKAQDIKVLDLRPLTSFADYFLLCNGANQRQIQAICDEVLRVMKQRGERPISLEGYDNAEWVLADFGDLLVHIFSEKSRVYYDLDRLWRDAENVVIPPEPRPPQRS
jgi:ribosome-associated protein